MEVVKFNALLAAKISSIYLKINQLKNTFHLYIHFYSQSSISCFKLTKARRLYMQNFVSH